MVQWHENSAHRRLLEARKNQRHIVLCDYWVFGIEVAREDVVAALPAEVEALPDKMPRTERCVADYVELIYGGKSGTAGISTPDIQRAIKKAIQDCADKRKLPSFPSIGRYLGRRKK